MIELNTLKVSGLNAEKPKCKTVGIGALIGVQVALCGVKCGSLNKETMKILGFHFLGNKTFEQVKYFH